MTTGSTKFGARPPLACEIAADRVLAGRSADAGRMVEMCSAQELAPGTVIPDLMESNLRDGTAIRGAIESALGGISGRSRDVIAILPDTAVRVVLLDFETLPSKPEEAEAVVRFRLKKSLPFNLDEARVSYHAQTGGTGLRAIAAGVLNTVAILDQEQVLLFRTLENVRGVTISGEQLAEEVYPSVVFFQDTYKLNIDRIYVAGLPETVGAAPALKAQTGATVAELVAASQIGATTGSVSRWRMAGVVGALIA